MRILRSKFAARFSLPAVRVSAFRYLRRGLNGARTNAARLKFSSEFLTAPASLQTLGRFGVNLPQTKRLAKFAQVLSGV